MDGGLIVETTPGVWAIYTELFVTEDASLYVVVAKDLTEYPETKKHPTSILGLALTYTVCCMEGYPPTQQRLKILFGVSNQICFLQAR